MSKPAEELELTFVVPCFNESPRIGSTLDNIRSACDRVSLESYEILVVDDCSTDDTAAVVEAYIEETGTGDFIRLVRHQVNRGLGRTYVDTSFLGRGKYYRLVCGDSTEPPQSIATILGLMGQADIIIPYHPKKVPGKPWFRRFISRLFTFLVNLISGHAVTYYNGCPLLLRYDVMRWGPYSYGFGFQADLTTRLLDEGRSYVEVLVEVGHVEKDSGASAIQTRNVLSVGHTLLELAVRRLRRRLYPPCPHKK